MIFVVAIVIFGLLAIPFAKKQAAKKGIEFSLIKHLLKIAALAVALFVVLLVKELYFSSPEQPVAPKPYHLPPNVQNNLHQ